LALGWKPEPYGPGKRCFIFQVLRFSAGGDLRWKNGAMGWKPGTCALGMADTHSRNGLRASPRRVSGAASTLTVSTPFPLPPSAVPSADTWNSTRLQGRSRRKTPAPRAKSMGCDLICSYAALAVSDHPISRSPDHRISHIVLSCPLFYSA
jgi:hypothetical protein